jgi:hypothetical protein
MYPRIELGKYSHSAKYNPSVLSMSASVHDCFAPMVECWHGSAIRVE